MAIQLLKTHTLTFDRVGDDDNKGYYDRAGNWIQTNVSTTVEAIGSLQPYRKAHRQLVLPEGTREQDVKVFYTKTQLRAFEQVSGLPADTIMLGGEKYTVFEDSEWIGFGLTADHYEYILIMDRPV